MTASPKICVVGSSNTDLVARTPRMPVFGETLHGHSFHIGFGGKGANQAVMAARLGGQVSMVTKLGRDTFGQDTLANYREQGIETTYVMFDDEVASGVALILVQENSGQNSIVIANGANGTITLADVRAASDAITSAQVLVCQLEIPLAASLEAFRIAKEKGSIQTIFNPAPAADLSDELLSLTDILIPNEVEAEMLVGFKVDNNDTATKAARELQQRGPQTVIITLGSRGVLISEVGHDPQVIAAEKVQAVDTTGAGDAFVGSFAYLLAAGRSTVDAARGASAIATRSVLKPGTQMSFPWRKDVLDVLEP
ncbi:MAG: ribokinase [Chloroflexi bacterium]|nr:ribokinase [Chloroflexota bacterium]